MKAPLYPIRTRQVTDDPDAGTTRAIHEVCQGRRVMATCTDLHDAQRIAGALEAADIARWTAP